MGIWKNYKRKKAAKRRACLESGSKGWQRYRTKDQKRGLRLYKKICKQTEISSDLIVFEAYQGKYYTCSPKAIYEELLENPDYTGYRFAWVVNDPDRHQYLKNDRLTIVKRGSRSYYEVMAGAKYRIANFLNAPTVPVRDGQIYIQTWHGTPMKCLGLDMKINGDSAYELKEIHAQFRREAKQMNYLVSPSAYATEKFVSAFGLTEEERKEKVLEVGYPRNAKLFTYTEEEVAELREFYGIPEGKKVILYAPTCRETGYRYGYGYANEIELDVERLWERFKDTACLLVRWHPMVDAWIPGAKYRDFLFKLDKVADINRLFVISDILVTDYSAVMFDFANLRRPMIFYMYDREQYQKEIREFYIEPESLPGPVVTSNEALEEALDKALSTPFVADEKYRAFCEKYTYLDDADAAKRVIKAAIKPLVAPDEAEREEAGRDEVSQEAAATKEDVISL